MISTFVTLEVDGSPMTTYVATPDGSGPHPGVLVAQHQGGVDDFIRSVCDRLAGEGYAVAAPDLYHRQETDITFDELVAIPSGTPRFDEVVRTMRANVKDEEVVRDVNAALAHLRADAGVGDSPVGITGFCMGGRTTYLMATRNASLQAAACFYGGNVFGSNGGGPPPFAGSDRITTHLMGFFGNDDANPSREDVDRIDAELTRLGVEHTFHRYDGTGHGFMNPASTGSYRAASAADAWPKLLAFFEERLKARVGAL